MTPTASKAAPDALIREYRCLVHCVRAVFDPTLRDSGMSKAWGEIDWDALAKLARKNYVDVLLLHGMRHCGIAAPAALLKRLSEYENTNRRRNVDNEAALLRLNAVFAERHLDVMTFKGPTMARRFYPDAGLRFSWDLDFLIPAHNPAALHAVLESENYRRDGDLSPRARRLYERYHFADSYTCTVPGGGPELDVHWRLFPINFPVGYDETELWRSSEIMEIEGAQLRTLSAVDALVYAAMHGAKEEWRRLQMVADVAAMLTSSSAPNLDLCLQRARAWRAERQLLLALHLAHRLLGTPIPATLAVRVDADDQVPWLAQDVMRRQQDLMNVGTSIFDYSVWRARTFDTRRARLRYAWRTATMARVEHLDILPVPLPNAALGPVRLLHDHVARPLRSGVRRMLDRVAR